MKLKIIDLLNLVYNKKAPKKIMYKYCEYELNPEINDYKNKDGLELFSYLFTNEEQALFLEVEIIEEKPKYIEKKEIDGEYWLPSKELTNDYEFKKFVLDDLEGRNETIEELRIAVNYLLKKEDEEYDRKIYRFNRKIHNTNNR